MIIALISVLGFAILSIVISFHGLGRRQVEVAPEDLLIFLKVCLLHPHYDCGE